MSLASTQILLVHGLAAPRPDILAALKARYSVQTCPLAALGPYDKAGVSLLVIDVEIRRESQAAELRLALGRLANRLLRRLFVVDEPNRLAIVRATAFGAEAVVARPIIGDALYPSVDRLIYDSCWDKPAPHLGPNIGLHAGVDAIENILQFASAGQKLTQDELYDQGDTVIGSLGEMGLADWIEAVKRHHCRTFRHSLLVTGIAVGFGQLLGFGHHDLQRLAIGGLLHDIGKASIPVKILEKPGALSEVETLVMREHAAMGRDILRQRGGFSDEMIAVVGNHHEFLDGSGYPDGITGDRISDLVRAITVADIFSALIEERAYKSRMSASQAYETMLRMDGKLDPALLREFSYVALRTPLGT